MGNFFEELKRRNVVKAAISYVVVSWATIQVTQILFEAFEIPTIVLRYVLFTLIGGFPLWLLFAYRFEWTPTGFKKTEDVEPEVSVSKQTGKRLNTIIIASLIVAVLLLLADRFFNITRPANQTGAPEKSIAVLPFADMSPGKDQEYFSDGLSEELLNLLAKIPDLKVIARTSSFAFKGKHEDLRIIGEKLGVAYILEGSVRKSGNTLRITTQLIKARDGSRLWNETYDRTLDDIFKVQDDIAGHVVQQLKVTLLGGNVPVSTIMKPEAYNLYIEGLYFARRVSKENLEKAEVKFKEALAIDSAVAPIWDGLSSVYSNQTGPGWRPVEEGIRLAKEAALKALELNPNYAPAHSSLSYIYRTFDLDFEKADKEIKKALELDPGNVSVISNAATLASSLGRLDEAIELGKKAIAADPLRSTSHFNLSVNYYQKGDWENAETSMRKVLELAPERNAVYYILSRIQLLSGQEKEAMESLEREPEEGWKVCGWPLIYSKLGRKAEADAALKNLIAGYSDDSAYQIAQLYSYRGEIDKAFEWLERAYQQQDAGLSLLMVDPLMRNLHNDLRWLSFLQKMNVANYWHEYKAKYLK